MLYIIKMETKEKIYYKFLETLYSYDINECFIDLTRLKFDIVMFFKSQKLKITEDVAETEIINKMLISNIIIDIGFNNYKVNSNNIKNIIRIAKMNKING